MELSNTLLKHLSLSYYANSLSVYFKDESIICHSMSIFNDKRK